MEWAFGGRKEDRFAICDLGTNEVALTVSQRRWVCQVSAVAQRWRSGAVARSLFVRAFVGSLRWCVRSLERVRSLGRANSSALAAYP